MRPEDYLSVETIWKASGLSYQPYGRDSYERVVEQSRKESSIYLVAEDDGVVVGSLLVTHDFRKGWMNRLAVAPERQGEGIASSLVERAEDELSAIGVSIFAAQIHRHNHRSRRLFSELGYEEHEDIVYCSKRPGRDE